MERLKTKSYKQIFSNDYFWRTCDRQEIDLIEERDGKLWAYEFNWQAKKVKAPKAWIKAYPGSEFRVTTKDNFLEFLL